MVKRILLLSLFGILFSAVKAHAYNEVLEVARSSGTVGRVICSTNTAIQVDSGVIYGVMGNGMNRHGVRIVNQDANYAIWIGFDSRVSSDTASQFLGEKIAAGGNAPYAIGNSIPLWCKAADGAAGSGVAISVLQTGYK